MLLVVVAKRTGGGTGTGRSRTAHHPPEEPGPAKYCCHSASDTDPGGAVWKVADTSTQPKPRNCWELAEDAEYTSLVFFFQAPTPPI